MMNFANPSEPRVSTKEGRLRKAVSKPLRQAVSHALLNTGQQYAAPHPPQWNQSSVNLTAVPAQNPYNQPYPPPYMHAGLYPNHQMTPRQNWASTTSLPVSSMPIRIPNEPQNVRDMIGDRFSEIISLIDEESYPDIGKELVINIPQTPPPAYESPQSHTGESERRLVPYGRSRISVQQQQQPQTRAVNVLDKLSYYSNSRLPASLPPFRAYIPTYPLLCLAALCSANAYQYRQNAVKDEQLIAANARIGTKAMVIKSVTCADEQTIVFAIRGTSVLSLRDWNVNLNTTPESPAGFLDDEGNFCHSGFLRVAKAMVKPIAARLRHLLEENPSRLSYSLLITGHSAGGAVASLLYAHMMSEIVKSELTILTDCFKRVHCVTFGAPPISLLPLRKPVNREHKLRKCLFHSFINEGDPVVRAEKAYIMSLVDLLTTTPSSASSLIPHSAPHSNALTKPSNLCSTSNSLLKITNLGILTAGGKKPKQQQHNRLTNNPSSQTLELKPSSNATWAVPPGTLSNAGRLVVLRGPEPISSTGKKPKPTVSVSQVDLMREFEEVRAFTVTDEEIRKVIFGDPMMHAMEVYRRRIEALAMRAVTGRNKYY